MLQKLWSEEWINNLGETSSLKAYKVINETQAQLEGVYLPSRIRRGIAEMVGRILRGQYKQMNCYYDCLEIVKWLGIEITEQKLVALVLQHCKTQAKNGKQYACFTRVMVEQTIRMIKNWQEKVGEYALTLHYVDLVQPIMSQYTFPFGPDDDQAIKYSLENQHITIEMKLPRISQPKNKSDWQWVKREVLIQEKIVAKIEGASLTHPHKPLLTKKTLKGGLEYFFLQFPWKFEERQEREGGKENRAHLWVDLEEERRRLYRKRDHLGEELAHTTTTILIQVATKWRCSKIIIEDLRDYKPPRGKRSWSRHLSYWLRGRIVSLLEYKCKEEGLSLQQVCPWGTSSQCPRCTAKGLKVKGPNNLIVDDRGRCFHCLRCGFTADRDYIAALNIYRASFIDYRTIRSLAHTSPVPYMDPGSPHPTVPGGGPKMNCTNSLVAMTGLL